MEYRMSRRLETYQGLMNIHEVLCLGSEDCPRGEPYLDGIWCDWTFKNIPEESQDINLWMVENEYNGTIHLVDENNKIVLVKTIEQLEAE